MISLTFPEGTEVELDDADARRLSDGLWEMVEQKRTAVVAVAIREELRRGDATRRPIGVPLPSVERVNAALDQLS
jgi:hypothetical protein